MTRRHRRRCSDENINLHIIKAAAIKAIEIMQIIRKRRCRGNFCRHLKSFRRLSPMNIEQLRTCRPPPLSNHSRVPLCTHSTSLPSPLPFSRIAMISSTNSSIVDDLVQNHARNALGEEGYERGVGQIGRRGSRREAGGRELEGNQNYLLKITLTNRRNAMCARPQQPREFQFYTQAHFNARRAKPGAPIGAQLKIIDDDNEPTLRAGEADRTGN